MPVRTLTTHVLLCTPFCLNRTRGGITSMQTVRSPITGNSAALRSFWCCCQRRLSTSHGTFSALLWLGLFFAGGAGSSIGTIAKRVQHWTRASQGNSIPTSVVPQRLVCHTLDLHIVDDLIYHFRFD